MTISPTRRDLSSDVPDSAELLIKEARRASRRRRFRRGALAMAFIVLVASVVSIVAYNSKAKPSTTTLSRGVSAADLPRCSASSDLSAKLIGRNGASGMSFFLVAFTNNGARSCSLSGVPFAQAVESIGGAPVGPPAKYLSLWGTPRGTVDLHSRGGRAYVEYYVTISVEWTTNQCGPQLARRVELNPDGIKRFYLPIDRLGFAMVCTKLPSTAIGPVSSKTY
jgi:Protein of unknown function (DUF4232)